jgi:hypothetical protein
MQILILLFGLLTFALHSESGRSEAKFDHKALELKDFNFTYQSNVEPWDSVTCKHEKATVGMFEWDVYCLVGRKVHRYSVHLVLSFYPLTRYGGSAYELLYWVTDWTTPRPVSDSTTTWFHQKLPDSKAAVIEAAQGIENDLSSLRLTVLVPD